MIKGFRGSFFHSPFPQCCDSRAPTLPLKHLSSPFQGVDVPDAQRKAVQEVSDHMLEG